MRASLTAVACTLACMPLLAFAASGDIPAGFAQTSIFASKTSIGSGDSVSLFSVLYNSSVDELTADVVFTIDGTSVGTKHVSLAVGETQTPSVSWTAAAGTHTASAHLENVVTSSGEGASISNTKSDTITLTVTAPPPPSAATQAIASVSSVIASSTPVVTNVAQKAYNSLEYLRANAVSGLQQQLASASAPASAASAKDTGEVLGTSTKKTDTPLSTQKDGVLSSIWRAILNALLFICNIRFLFYGLLLVVLFVLYRLLRTWMSER